MAALERSARMGEELPHTATLPPPDAEVSLVAHDVEPPDAFDAVDPDG